jgi:hypothetical protein
MKINDQIIARFDNEIRIFAKRYGLTAETEHTTFNERTDVRLSSGIEYKRYVLEWNDVPNFAAAMNGIIRDAQMFFGARRVNNRVVSECPFIIKDVIFNNPATIVFWTDGTKTVVKCQEDDIYSEEVGLALCFAKKALGNKSNFNNVFKKWIPEVQSNYVYQGTIDISKLGLGVKSPADIAAELKKVLNEV